MELNCTKFNSKGIKFNLVNLNQNELDIIR